MVDWHFWFAVETWSFGLEWHLSHLGVIDWSIDIWKAYIGGSVIRCGRDVVDEGYIWYVGYAWLMREHIQSRFT